MSAVGNGKCSTLHRPKTPLLRNDRLSVSPFHQNRNLADIKNKISLFDAGDPNNIFKHSASRK